MKVQNLLEIISEYEKEKKYNPKSSEYIPIRSLIIYKNKKGEISNIGVVYSFANLINGVEIGVVSKRLDGKILWHNIDDIPKKYGKPSYFLLKKQYPMDPP